MRKRIVVSFTEEKSEEELYKRIINETKKGYTMSGWMRQAAIEKLERDTKETLKT